MSEILLQTIVEKLQVLEAAIFKKEDAPKEDKTAEAIIEHLLLLQTNVKKILNNYDELPGKLNRILTDSGATKSQSFNTVVEHEHHLHKGIWAEAILLILSVILSMGWINSNNSREQFRANDIKYRSLKVTGSSQLLNLLYQTDSLYALDKKTFTDQVELNEQQLMQRVRLLQLANEKKKETHLINKKLKKN